jgi:hypothetical protein
MDGAAAIVEAGFGPNDPGDAVFGERLTRMQATRRSA